jgi:hypothetical protein
MTKYITPGTITAVLSVAAIVAGAFGKTALAAFFTDPATAQSVLAAAGAVGTLVAGVLAGVKPADAAK